MKDPTHRIVHWLITLGEYLFIAIYREGGNRVELNNECETTFVALKQSLTTDCVRRFPDPNRPFEMHTDASDYAKGCPRPEK
eukprot:gene1748-3376_t